MAFMGIFLINLIIFLVIISITTSIAAAFFIAAAVLKKRQMKLKESAEAVGNNNYKVQKTYVLFRVLGGIFSFPLVAVTVLLIAAVIADTVHKTTSLSYNVYRLNTTRVERILRMGVTPDCTEESNAHAQNGEPTLLYQLVTYDYDTRLSSQNLTYEEYKEKEIEMMRLLIKYGADVNYVTYNHDKNYPEHQLTDDYSMYNSSDECGSTPLMAATYRADLNVIKLLVENGADVNAVDYCGYNVIDIVADNLNDEQGYEIYKYYIEQGVDPNNATNFNQNAAWLAFRQSVGSSPLKNDKIRASLEALE